MDNENDQDFVLVEDNDIHGYDEELLPQTPETLAAIFKWLTPTDYLGEASEYNKHLASYVAGTDLWIQQTEAYQQWHDSPDHGSLWTKAIAGAGKSVFAAMLTAQLTTTEQVPVMFFFFRQIIATNHHPQSLVRDWIAMILRHSPSLQARMKKYMDDRRGLDNISTNEFWQDLVRALVSFSKVYCIVDALDEMDIDQEHFLKNLVALGKRKPSTIKLLMTSRPLPRIEIYLKDPSILQVRLEQVKVDKDIALYVTHRLQNRADLDEPVRNAITQSIGVKSKGSFLYARLMMDEMLDHTKHMIPRVDYIQRSLDWLPVTLEDMYNGMLLDHSLRSRVPQELQLTILQWVTHSSRPLRLLELADMLDSQSSTGRVAKDTKAVVRAACGPLLEILEDETVSVIHHSFTEFLTDAERSVRPVSLNSHPQFPVIDPATTHNTMALACLKYLTSGCLNEWKIQPYPPLDAYQYGFDGRRKSSQVAIRMRHPFLAYAMSNLCIHVSKLKVIDYPLLEALDDFMIRGDHALASWLDLNWYDTPDPSKLSAVHIAAGAGMTYYVKHLLDFQLESNGLDGAERTPLSWASSRGFTDIVALLLEHVSDPDVPAYDGLKPLHYAAQANHHPVVRLLLAAGVSPTTGKTKPDPGMRCGNARSSIGDSPLMYCCISGAVESLKEMMPYLKPENLREALRWTVSSGEHEAVELLLTSPDTSVDHPDYIETPLFIAASGGHFAIMQSLLKRGANPDKTSSSYLGFSGSDIEEELVHLGPTSLHAVCGRTYNGYNRHFMQRSSDDDAMEKCFNLLLETRCDINAKGENGVTALHYLTQHLSPGANTRCCKRLLDNGADVMAQDLFGNTPLHLLQLGQVGNDGTNILDALMAKGADFTKRNSEGQTPVFTMLRYTDDIKTLRRYVSQWNIQDSDGNTPLHIMFSRHSSSLPPACAVKDLLAAGGDLTQMNKKGEAPIHGLRPFGEPGRDGRDFLAELLDAGADLNLRDRDGRTVLLRQLAYNHVGYENKEVNTVLSHGADINVVDYEGNGPLHQVCKRFPDTSLIKLLLDAGADPLCVNNLGNTPLHEALNAHASIGAEDRLVASVELLLQYGVPPAARNNRGQTALHFACGSYPTRYVSAKIEPFGFFLTSELGKSINTEDSYGIRPIHLAATVSESILSTLIRVGADATAVTQEGKNLLHITARTRNPNAIGLLLDHFRTIGRSDLIDAQDDKGRTPLHEACRSGQPESVGLLLKAGANVNVEDKRKLTPLHACAEFQEENLFWSTAASKLTPPRLMAACAVLESDPLRPESNDCCEHRLGCYNSWRHTACHEDIIKFRETIQLLLRSGAELMPSRIRVVSSFNLAISKKVAAMVDELLPHMKKHQMKAMEKVAPPHYVVEQRDEVLERHLVTTARATVLSTDLKLDGENPHNTILFEHLLSLGDSTALERLPEMGVDLLYKPPYRDNLFTTLVKCGYAALLRTLGATISRTDWVNGKTDPENTSTGLEVAPYIMTAVTTQVSNVEVLKVLVEDLKADVNIQPLVKDYILGNVPGPSPLHKLACGCHWWQSQGLEYLLKHGANTEVKDQHGQTPLHAAVSQSQYGSYRRDEAVTVLLEHGADPNATNEGETCLVSAMHNPELVLRLVKAGADINSVDRPAIFTAIAAQNLELVATLLDAGADCNIRQAPMEDNHKRHPSVHRLDAVHRVPPHEFYPVHYAADSQFNTPKRREKAIEIIKLLLESGADPFGNFRAEETLIHDILEHGGIMQPFLDIPYLDLEHRDPKGRTLLLAAARSGFGTFAPSVIPVEDCGNNWSNVKPHRAKLSIGDPLPAQTVYEKGGYLFARDNEGNNVLHFLSVAPIYNMEQYQKTTSLFIEKAPSLVHQKNAGGWKPLHYALQKQRVGLVEALLAAGADPLESDPLGNTPLHNLGMTMAEPEWFKRFLELGVPINGKNRLGETPMFVFFGHDHEEKRWENNAIFEALGADIYAKNNEGETLLHIVAAKTTGGNTSLFKVFMLKGLDPMVEDNSQRTSLDIAAAYGNTGILKLFKRDNGPMKVVEPNT